MEDRNQHIDQYFRQQLGSYTEQPAPDVWAALEQRLDEKPRKKRVLWVWFTLLFMAAIGGTTFYAYRVSKDNAIPATQNATATKANTTTTHTDITTSLHAPSHIAAGQPQTSAESQKDSRAIRKTVPTITPVKQGHASQPTVPTTTIDETETVSNVIETPTTNRTPLRPVEPLNTEIKKPETERDILLLLPTVGVPVPIAKMNEEEYLALAPMAGNKKTDNAAVPVSTSPATDPASISDSIETASKTQPAISVESQQVQSVNPIPDTPIAEKEHFRRFSAGLKTGYEFGTKPYHANSFLLSPYLQYNFTKRFGLLLQPAFKYSRSSAAVLSHGSYTQTTDSLKEMLPPIIPNAGSGFPTANDEYMAYQKTYDSIFIRSELRDVRYWNLDLPLMLSYKVHKNFSVYAGPAFHFTKVPKVVTTKQTYSGLVLNDTLRMERKPMSVEFDTLDINEVFPQKGFDLSQYNGSAFDNPTINPFKMGVTFGLSYTFRQRFHFDILYRQTLSKMEYIANDKVREILKQPYIRVTLGFDLLK